MRVHRCPSAHPYRVRGADIHLAVGANERVLVAAVQRKRPACRASLGYRRCDSSTEGGAVLRPCRWSPGPDGKRNGLSREDSIKQSTGSSTTSLCTQPGAIGRPGRVISVPNHLILANAWPRSPWTYLPNNAAVVPREHSVVADMPWAHQAHVFTVPTWRYVGSGKDVIGMCPARSVSDSLQRKRLAVPS